MLINFFVNFFHKLSTVKPPKVNTLRNEQLQNMNTFFSVPIFPIALHSVREKLTFWLVLRVFTFWRFYCSIYVTWKTVCIKIMTTISHTIYRTFCIAIRNIDTLRRGRFSICTSTRTEKVYMFSLFLVIEIIVWLCPSLEY